MKIISAKFHGFIDYATAVVLILAPFIIFPAGAPLTAKALSVVAGIALILYSLVTDYSVSVRNAIPFKVQLGIDFIAGAAFVAAPFVLGFTGLTQHYFIVMGAAIIAVVLLTDSNIEEEQ